jgi:hypothetical protein
VQAIVVHHVVTTRDCDGGWREVAGEARPITVHLRGSGGPAKASRVLDASTVVTLP